MNMRGGKKHPEKFIKTLNKNAKTTPLMFSKT